MLFRSIRKVEGYRNYDKSEFDKVSSIASSDDDIAAIWDKQYALKDFVDPSRFKSYDELKAKLNAVLNAPAAPQKRAEEIEVEDTPVQRAAPVKTQAPKPVVKKEDVNFDDDDESMSYFAKLANDD